MNNKKKKYKVLMIAPTPFFADRGCHVRIYEEAIGLQRLGNEVVICTYGLGNNVPDVSVVRTINFPWYKKISAGPSKTKLLLLPVLGILTLKQIRKYKPDVIHAHLHEGACIAKICKIFYPKLIYVFDMQGGLVDETLQHGFIKKNSIGYKILSFLERRIITWHHIITSSSNIINNIKKMGCNKFVATNVSEGTDDSRFCPSEPNGELVNDLGIDIANPRLMFVGLLEKYQGVDILIDAFEDCLKVCPNLQLIIGGYPNVEKYRELCRDKGIEDNVFFTGRISYLELSRYLSLANICVAPKLSLTEGNGKLYNYMAMGIPSVCFDTPINREILGESGIYVQQMTKEALTKKILWAINNKIVCKELGRKSRKIIENRYSNELVAKRIIEVYQEIESYEK